MSPVALILAGWIGMAVVMAVLWLIQRRFGDAGIVDIGWTMGVGSLALFFCLLTPDGNLARRVLIASLTMLWALRLSGYILRRVLTQPEDGRYQSLKAEWGATAQRKLFQFYQFQALGSVLFALPMLVAAGSRQPLGGWDLAGVLVWLAAVAGELVADQQLARFRADPAQRGRVCQQGLWRYSRHPNYFFEWLHWWAYVCLAVTAPWGWLTILAPVAMFYFITRVTGIPPTEAQSLRSRGDAYREYQRTTSAFIPWLPKRS